jgi:hypothetical protein
MRYYSNARVARLAMLFTLNGALLAAKDDLIGPHLRGCIGIPVVVFFWLADQEIRQYWKVLLDRAKQIEELLGIEQYTRLAATQDSKPGWRRWTRRATYFSSTFSTRATYLLLALLWLTNLIRIW